MVLGLRVFFSRYLVTRLLKNLLAGSQTDISEKYGYLSVDRLDSCGQVAFFHEDLLCQLFADLGNKESSNNNLERCR